MQRLATKANRWRKPDDAALAWYAQDLARTLAAGVPALEAEYAPSFEDAIARCLPDGGDLLGDLERAMQRMFRADRFDDALRAANILRGAAVQARRTDEKVDRLRALKTSAVRVIREIRELRAAEAPAEAGRGAARDAARRPARVGGGALRLDQPHG